MCKSLARWLLGGLLVTSVLLTILSPAGISAAHPPRQEGEQPQFAVTTQTSPDGNGAIELGETRLDSAYFAVHGNLENVNVGPTGLSLAQGQSSGVYSSGIIYSPLAFTTDIVPLWQADPPEGAGVRLETRLSLDGGDSWSDWLDNPEAFYPVRDGLHSGHLIWIGSERAALQFRIILDSTAAPPPSLNSLTLVFNDTSRGPTDGAIAGQMATANLAGEVCPVSKPAVVSRTTWGCPDGQLSPRRPPVYQPVTHIILHQAETPNTVEPYQDWAGWVRSVWNYHANVLWWGDVGYNYLIDPNGTIYEGRAGGDDVVGIHDRYNRGSMAIGFLGCYGNCDDPRLSEAEPSQAMLAQAELLMAWKLGQQGIDPLSADPYAGLDDVPVIAGGRDVVPTTSPGDNLYDRLAELRATVAQKVTCSLPDCQVELTLDKAEYRVGETVTLTATVSNGPGARVTATVEGGGKPVYGPFELAGTGPYTGQYTDTSPAGTYLFKAKAEAPIGQEFVACLTEKIAQVISAPTGVVVKVEPVAVQISACLTSTRTAVKIQDVAALRAVDLEINFDPNVVQVVDADPGRPGMQVGLGSPFVDQPAFVAQNEADNSLGRIRFAATLLGDDLIDGEAELVVIDWSPHRTGITPVTPAEVTLVGAGGQSISNVVEAGSIQVTPNCQGPIIGIILLQGRTEHSGILISSASGQQTRTEADGSFSISSNDLLNFKFPGYLSAQADLPARLAQTGRSAGPSTSLGTITLPAGDLNGDDVINIYDLAYLAARYRTSDSLADLNADGLVNILDLALAAGNYQKQGPLADWPSP